MEPPPATNGFLPRTTEVEGETEIELFLLVLFTFFWSIIYSLEID